MPSLLATFEYDIFISYRHNDNRSGWVTEFIKALQEELAATIKEPISIYFDTNPHDGLLETHLVDKSLEGKLKCLILIPIISQTYCDTKSFAWQHEFVAFNKLAKEDPCGRDIKLSNGNVASRILPIKIHDLDSEDKSLFESESGGVLRAIEFIYREAGVNRPLKADDNERKNLNGTTYRNQVNKMANAIKEIISTLKSPVGKISTQVKENYSTPSGATRKVKNKRIAAISVGLMILLALFYGISQFIGSANREPEILDKSIAVLPFVDMSPGKDQEYFGDGIAEEIINALAQVEELRVIARTSSFQFKGKNEDLRKIGEILGVATILEGSVRKSKDQLRITAQLINTSDGAHLWSKTFDRSTEDIFKVQDEIAALAVDALKISLAGGLKPTRSMTKNEEAYNLYLQGRIFFDRNSGSDSEIAASLFRKAINLDSSFALAWVYYADSKRRLTPNPDDPGWQDAKTAVRKGMELDPALPDAHISLALIARNEFDLSTAETEARKALSLDSRNARSLRAAAGVFTLLGRFEESIKLLDKTFAIDPLQPVAYSYLLRAYYCSGRLEEAQNAWKKQVSLSPDFLASWGLLDVIFLRLQREGAQALLQEINAEKDERIKLSGTSLARFSLGQKKESDNALSQLKEKYSNKFAYGIAQVHAFRNEKEDVFRWLDRAYIQKDLSLVSLKVDPVLKDLRDDARFRSLLKKMRFPE